MLRESTLASLNEISRRIEDQELYFNHEEEKKKVANDLLEKDKVIITYSEFLYYLRDPCYYYLIGGIEAPTFDGFGLTKSIICNIILFLIETYSHLSDSTYRTVLNQALSKLQSNGRIKTLKEKWLKTIEPLKCMSSSTNDALTLDKIGGIFILLILGILLAFLIFIFELKKQNVKD